MPNKPAPINFRPVSAKEHGARRWRHAPNQLFASKMTHAQLALGEFVQASHEMPICFMQIGDVLAPVALLGFQKEENLFVDARGRWLSAFKPWMVRAYPFIMAPVQEKLTLCVDQNSDCVTSDPSDKPFFGDAGEVSKELQAVVDFLQHIQGGLAAVNTATATLLEAGVIEPWPLEIDIGGAKYPVNGLKRVSEKALNALPDAEFVKLRAHGALGLAHAQLMSMIHVHRLSRAVTARLQAKLSKKAAPQHDLLQDDLIRF